MAHAPHITGEKFDHKVAAIFATEAEAQNAAEEVRLAVGLEEKQVFVLRPNDPHEGRKLEPEDGGIWRTMIRSHLWLGGIGAVVGLLLFMLAFSSDVRFIVTNAMAAAALFVGFGAVLGMMLAGLISLRPDHLPYIIKAQSALREGKSVVAVHARSVEQSKQAIDELEKHHAQVVNSL